MDSPSVTIEEQRPESAISVTSHSKLCENAVVEGVLAADDMSIADKGETETPSAENLVELDSPLISDPDREPVLWMPETSLWLGREKYDNPWDTWRPFYQKFGPLLKWKFCNKPNFAPDQEEANKNLPIKDKHEIKKEIGDPVGPGQVRVTWLGHASVLLQFEKANVLCDPVFSSRIGPLPVPLISYARYRPPPLEVEDLPDIHAVVISHNHYDHLDHPSVKDLHEKFGNEIHWFVPKGLQDWMLGCGIMEDNVEEMMWWEEKELKGTDLKITFTPTQHWCVRSGFDKNEVLWGSFAICTKNIKTWFGGDTGYCKAFQDIGKKFNGFDFAAIPIGAFRPRYMMKDQHVCPEESVKIHKDLRCKKSLGIHWGTFTMGCIEGYMEPKEELEQQRRDAGIKDEDFFILNHGESKIIEAITETE